MSDGASDADVGFSVDWQPLGGERTSTHVHTSADMTVPLLTVVGAFGDPDRPGRGQQPAVEGSDRAGSDSGRLAGRSGGNVVDLATVDDPCRWGMLSSPEFVDGPSRASLDRLVRLACDLLEAPAGLLAVVDRDRQFWLAACGLLDRPAESGPAGLGYSICRCAVVSCRPLIVGDTRADPILAAIPAVSETGVAAYAAIPMIGPAGRAFASLCVMDFTGRDWDDYQLAILARLADIATDICVPDQRWSPNSDEEQRVASTPP